MPLNLRFNVDVGGFQRPRNTKICRFPASIPQCPASSFSVSAEKGLGGLRLDKIRTLPSIAPLQTIQRRSIWLVVVFANRCGLRPAAEIENLPAPFPIFSTACASAIRALFYQQRGQGAFKSPRTIRWRQFLGSPSPKYAFGFEMACCAIHPKLSKVICLVDVALGTHGAGKAYQKAQR